VREPGDVAEVEARSVAARLARQSSASLRALSAAEGNAAVVPGRSRMAIDKA
jgi:hypothetical protein